MKHLPWSWSIPLLLLSLIVIAFTCFGGKRTAFPSLKVSSQQTTDSSTLREKYTAVIIDAPKQKLNLYWQDSSGKVLGSIAALQQYLEAQGKRLNFAMNGGMFQTDLSPVGLLIQDGTVRYPLNNNEGKGNFYLKPNGVFLLTSQNKAVVCRTEDLKHSLRGIRFATQSGPMLLINGQIHPAFQQDSPNLNIRNGVGIMPDGKAVFVISNTQVNFYDFASYFRKLGCRNALYLDGFVSRLYSPRHHYWQTDGQLGVIIAAEE